MCQGIFDDFFQMKCLYRTLKPLYTEIMDTEHETKFHDLTEEEYDALDEKWTKNPPKPGPNGTGFFAQCLPVQVYFKTRDKAIQPPA
jgi:hypothetical protein